MNEVVSNFAEAVDWLQRHSTAMIRASRREMADGTAAFPPQVASHYDAFWSQFAVDVAWRTFGNTRDLVLLRDIIEPLLRGLNAVPRSERGLVWIAPDGWDRCPYGFTDSQNRRGIVLLAAFRDGVPPNFRLAGRFESRRRSRVVACRKRARRAKYSRRFLGRRGATFSVRDARLPPARHLGFGFRGLHRRGG